MYIADAVRKRTIHPNIYRPEAGLNFDSVNKTLCLVNLENDNEIRYCFCLSGLFGSPPPTHTHTHHTQR